MDMVKFNKDKHFEERLVQALIIDHQFAEQMVEFLDTEYFNTDYLKESANIIFNNYNKHQSFPSFGLFETITKSDIKNQLIRDQILQYIVKIKTNPLNGDMGYVKDASLDFCKTRSLVLALEKSLDLIEDKRYEQVLNEVQEAIMKGSEKDVGHIYLEHLKRRMAEDVRNPIPTPWKEVNKYLKGGGVSGGELSVLCMPTGVGKTHGLVDIGSSAIQNAYSVVHYTLELNEIDVGNRYDSNLSGIAPENLRKNQEIVAESMKKVKGNLVIKSYPTKSASVLTIKNHLHKLAMRDIRPDLVIVDYGDLMRSTKNYKDKRFEEERCFEDLRGLGGEFNFPVWTATQTNRSGIDEDIITLKHVAECFAKAQISDLFITVNRKKDGYRPTLGKMFIAKSRVGPDGIIFPVLINTSLSRFDVRSPDDIDIQDPNIPGVPDAHTDSLRKTFLAMKRNHN